MSTTAPTAAAPASSRGRPPRTGPIRRVIACSLLTGAAIAALLTLLVFGGAPEHAITGSALCGFAAGWAMLAVLSTRMTDQPQRWALVPAAGLAAIGLGLLVLAPDDGTLTSAGWAWPPVMLVLAVWMGVQVRRRLRRGSGRWLLYPLVTVIAVAAVGGAVETIGLTDDQRSYVMPGQSYDVGGYRLHLYCTGSGSPTVVLQNGLGETSANWARLTSAVAGTTRVCSYDRAGQGWSDDAPRPQDGLQAAADLNTLLQRAGEDGPYVLVGHSIGGNHAMAFATRYPERVAGMVLLDTTDPYRSADGTGHTGPPSSIALVPSLARLGIGRLLPASFWSALPEPAAGQVRAFASSPRHWRNVRDESATLRALLDQASALTSLGSTPLVIVTAAGRDSEPAWAAAQDQMATLSTNSSHRHSDAGHAALLDEERGAADSVRAIEDVVQAVRTGKGLTPA